MKHLKTNLFSRSFPKSPVVPAQYVIFGRCIIDLVFYFTYLHALANTVALLIFQTFKSYPGAAHIRRKPTSSQPEVKEGGKTYVVALKLKKIRVGECLPVHPMIDAQLSLSLSLISLLAPADSGILYSVGRSVPMPNPTQTIRSRTRGRLVQTERTTRDRGSRARRTLGPSLSIQPAALDMQSGHRQEPERPGPNPAAPSVISSTRRTKPPPRRSSKKYNSSPDCVVT